MYAKKQATEKHPVNIISRVRGNVSGKVLEEPDYGAARYGVSNHRDYRDNMKSLFL